MANQAKTPTGGTNSTSNTRNGFGSGATFSPGFNININKGTPGVPQQPGAAANPGTGVGRTSPLALPEPAFYSAADVRSYCEALRAFGAYSAIEVEVAAEILKAALEQAPNVPGDNPFSRKMRARAVARKLAKAADALTDAAKDAAAAWAAFQREYADVMTPQRPQPQHRPFQF
ncbi:sporulation protein SsgA [Kitasatospora sp. NA04385]|uniref:plasmid transfer protein TraA n=1 Tax=Kitasatospora TaxID=2063 RepID=UPI0006905B62|nr:plasmid transfer protein TraA [Kitasatospora sp. NA04385]QKW20489.1 sporulation protein SsgA [Kitasatospora sp. NA04385]